MASLLATVCLSLMLGAAFVFRAHSIEMQRRFGEINAILSVLPDEYPQLLDELDPRSGALVSTLAGRDHIRAEVALLCFQGDPNPVRMVETLMKSGFVATRMCFSKSRIPISNIARRAVAAYRAVLFGLRS